MKKEQKEMLQKITSKLNDTSKQSMEFMKNLSDEQLCQSELYENCWLATRRIENMVELLTVYFDLDVENQKS